MKRQYTLAMLVACLALLPACKDEGRSRSAQPANNSAMNESFVTRLDAQGYYRGLAPEKVQALKEDFRQKGWMAIFSESHRYFHADAEDLAEGGICKFIREVQPFLSAQGVKVPDLRDEVSDKGYVVRVGGVPHKIYDAVDLKRDATGKEPGIIWGLAMARGFAIVDQLLESAGSAERVYAINGGNDLFAIFLTPDLHKTISERPDADAKDGPYKPTEEYP
jgi:hypothetical protein